MLLLSPDELSELTGKATAPAQARVLDAIGIPYRIRPDRSLIVLRLAVESALGQQLAGSQQRRPQLRFNRRATAQA